ENTIMLWRRSVLSVSSRQRRPTPGLGIDILGYRLQKGGTIRGLRSPGGILPHSPELSRGGRLQPGQEAGDLLPIRPIARRLRKADPASHLLHEGADICRTLWLNYRMHSWSARRPPRGSSLA